MIFELWFEENSDERIERAQNKKKNEYRERIMRKVLDKKSESVCIKEKWEKSQKKKKKRKENDFCASIHIL